MSARELERRTDQRRDRPRRSASTVEHREGVRLMVAGDDLPVGVEVREQRDGDKAPTLFGHFTPYDRWTEIDSFFEGNFMERTLKGAFKRTIAENRDAMKVLFQHGRDPQVGMKPLGPIDVLREEDAGPYYEVPLLDAGYVRNDILPGLRAKLYGASYKFRVMREEVIENPGVSSHNPKGIPERTIKEAQVFEFGPVTFPAFQDASAGVRSVTDDYFLEGLAAAEPELVRAAANGDIDFQALVAHQQGHLEGRTMDPRDVGTVAKMLHLAAGYLAARDRSDDESPMLVIQSSLIDLLAGEARETEAVTEQDDEEAPTDEPADESRDDTDDDESTDAEEHSDEDDDAATAAPTNGTSSAGARTEENGKPVTDPAAPGPRPTPLLGIQKEPWRL